MIFWKDKRCGDNMLSVSFPSLFALVDSKDIWVEDVWNYVEGRRGGGGILVFLVLLMIRRWIAWRDFYHVCMGRECVGM